MRTSPLDRDPSVGHEPVVLYSSLHTVTDSVNALNSQTLGYTANDQLTSAVSGAGGYVTWSWTWDPVGNVKAQVIAGTTTTFTLNTSTNQLQKWVTGLTTENVTHTSAGNISLLKVGATTLTSLSYNAANQMNTGTGSSLSATYIYGYDGQRLTKTFSGSAPITFQYGLSGELLSENDLSGGQAADYIYLNGQPIGEIDPNAGTLYFMHTDRLGTPQRVTDGTQAVVWNAYYQPFGDNGTGSITGTLATQSLRLPGQYADPETGFNHNGFRDYFGFTTRYVQSDPIGLSGGMNTYAYVAANPLKRIDPNGLTWTQTMHQFWEWSSGTAPAQEWFGPDTNQTKDMKADLGVQKALQYWAAKNQGKCQCNGQNQLPVTNYSVKFGLKGLWNAGTNSTQQFVGSYTVDIYPDQKGNVKVVLTNTTSLTSFLYGLWPDTWNLPAGYPGGNYTQYYVWTQAAPDMCQ